jgi:branched-chain amino acid transport system substrate-binding protein
MKKFLCMMMAVLMVLAMAACGGEPANNGGNDTPDATTVKIGGIGPLTGAYANYGLSEKNGAELAVKEINEAGGIAGKQIELSYQDSQGESESAVNAYGKLMDWGMEVSLGCVLSGENASVVAAARDDDVLLITPSGSADKCIDGNDKAFRVCFYDSYQGAAAAQYIKDNNMVDTVGILYQSDNDYSVGLYNAFVAKCGELGITIAETQTFTSSTNTDFSTQVSALVSSGVKLVFIPLYAEEASTFLTQAHGKFADDVYFFGADGLDGILGKVEQDTSLANNVLMLTPFAADNPAENVQSFVKKYQEAYGATPDQFAADAYDAIYVIKAAVEKAGSTSGAALASALTSLTVEGVTGIMTWTADGNTNKPASAILYYDGVGTLFDSQD